MSADTRLLCSAHVCSVLRTLTSFPNSTRTSGIRESGRAFPRRCRQLGYPVSATRLTKKAAMGFHPMVEDELKPVRSSLCASSRKGHARSNHLGLGQGKDLAGSDCRLCHLPQPRVEPRELTMRGEACAHTYTLYSVFHRVLCGLTSECRL